MAEVRYSLRRSELWLWYRRAWRTRLWKRHVVIVSAIFVGALAVPAALDARLLVATVLSVALLAVMVAYPQLRFKPQERSLEIDPMGLRTSIKSSSKAYSWSDVASIDEGIGHIIITLKNLNAFIIPSRAFADEEARNEFLTSARTWSGAR